MATASKQLMTKVAVKHDQENVVTESRGNVISSLPWPLAENFALLSLTQCLKSLSNDSLQKLQLPKFEIN
jgi:hypothetical protein